MSRRSTKRRPRRPDGKRDRNFTRTANKFRTGTRNNSLRTRSRGALMSEYIETSEYHTAVAKAKRQASDAAQAINSFISRHPEIRDVDANRSVIYQYYNGDLTDITAESLEECWSTHPRFKAMLACFPSEADERQTLESRILELLKSGTSAENLKSISAGF